MRSLSLFIQLKNFLLSTTYLILILIPFNNASADKHDSLPSRAASPTHFLRFAVVETLLGDNWLTIPGNFSEHLITWDDIPATASTGSQAQPPHWEAIMLSGEETAIGCAQGWLVAFYKKSCGKPAGYLHSALIWYKDRFSAPPDWSSLWDIVRHPGKRGLPEQARGALEIALLSNHVPPSDIYKVLATPGGQKLAFTLLDRIRPFISWYRTTDEFQKLLHGRNIIIGVAPLSSVTSTSPAETKPSFIPNPAYSVYSKRFWGIPSSLSAAQRTLTEKVLDEAAPHLTYDFPAMTTSSLIINDDFWMIYAPILEPVFDKWLETGTLNLEKISP